MLTALQFMQQYRNLSVAAPIDDTARRMTRVGSYRVQLRTYFMMNWTAGTEQRKDYDAVTTGSKHDAWFKANTQRIQTAAMGKGAPRDYELALEWAVRSGKIPVPTQASIQAYCDAHLGIDCSGFVTNYLAACGKRTYSMQTVCNTSAQSYFSASSAVNDPAEIRAGNVLVWMQGNSVKSNPGHVAVIDSYSPHSIAGGNMRVVEATGAAGAHPKLLDSMYSVESIIPKGDGGAAVMILVVRRHGVPGSRVAVMKV